MQATNNKFLSMPYIPFKIVMALLENDNFAQADKLINEKKRIDFALD